MSAWNTAWLSNALDRILARLTDDRDESGGATTDVPPTAATDTIDEWSIRRIVATMLPLLALMSLLQMGSGSVLEAFEEQLLDQPALLVLVPVQIGTAGNLGSIMCSRLSTQLHLGTFELDPRNPDIRANVGAVFGLAATVFVLLGVAAWGIGRFLGGTLALEAVMAISVISGMILAVWVVVVSIVSIWASYRLGYNPDDTTIPVVTNVCDITGVLILFGVVTIVL
jgi:mgtE-like transporter